MTDMNVWGVYLATQYIPSVIFRHMARKLHCVICETIIKTLNPIRSSLRLSSGKVWPWKIWLGYQERTKSVQTDGCRRNEIDELAVSALFLTQAYKTFPQTKTNNSTRLINNSPQLQHQRQASRMETGQQNRPRWSKDRSTSPLEGRSW